MTMSQQPTHTAALDMNDYLWHIEKCFRSNSIVPKLILQEYSGSFFPFSRVSFFRSFHLFCGLWFLFRTVCIPFSLGSIKSFSVDRFALIKFIIFVWKCNRPNAIIMHVREKFPFSHTQRGRKINKGRKEMKHKYIYEFYCSVLCLWLNLFIIFIPLWFYYLFSLFYPECVCVCGVFTLSLCIYTIMSFYSWWFLTFCTKKRILFFATSWWYIHTRCAHLLTLRRIQFCFFHSIKRCAMCILFSAERKCGSFGNTRRDVNTWPPLANEFGFEACVNYCVRKYCWNYQLD